MAKDFVDEMVEEFTSEDPEFPKRLDAAKRRRNLVRALADKREESKRTQKAVALVMGTTQSSVARIEAASNDLRLSTLDRYASAVGCRVEYALVPDAASAEHVLET